MHYQNLFAASLFIPHGHCYLWKPELILLHTFADSSIALAYYSIPATLVYFVRRRNDLPFAWIFLLFGSFIVSCGTTHIMEIWTLWHPSYWLSGLIKVITALISLYTAISLVPLVPKALALRSPVELETANRKLETQIKERKQAEIALQQSEARYRAIVEDQSELICRFLPDGTILFVNEAYCRYFGQIKEELIGSSYQPIIFEEDREIVAKLLETLNAENPTIRIENRVVVNKEIRWTQWNNRIIFDRFGRFMEFQSVGRDITAQKQAEMQIALLNQELEARVKQRTFQLEERNQELDRFAYVISHDLKAPLRAIANLSQWLEEDLEDSLSEETQHQMNLLRNRVYRMEALINGLLEYSRVGRINSPPQEVNVERMLTEIIDSLAVPPEFTILVGEKMPTFVTQLLPLQQVFSNLISNSIKHHHRSAGNIEISVRDLEQFYEFTVIDDGPGIAPEYHEKVFVIFQTLQPRDKVENTGVGLSIVKKTIENQGGTINIESQANRGTTFRFTWPKTKTKRL